jgi:arylsulfatase A-like enzyme
MRWLHTTANAKEPFLLYLPLTSPHTPLAANRQWLGKSGLNLYADFVMETDATVGRMLVALHESGAAENTVVLFTSDNGCAPYVGAQELESKGHFPSGPLRGYKGDVFEGGHRVPFIVRWPGVVKPGAVCGQLVHHADLMATVADILSTRVPDNAGEDSFSLLPLLKGEDKPVREHTVSCASSGVPGLRRGPWKLILERDPKAKTDVQLYDLNNDIGEKNNLAADKPEIVTEMRALMERLITDGRSTPGAKRRNDVEVRRYPVVQNAKKKAASKQEKK